ncbi:MAG: C25 family cysteine peptidase [Thermoplasmata archaeon]|nr:C25 family cysteine peptidase [Thermoplasmata archaeon]
MSRCLIVIVIATLLFSMPPIMPDLQSNQISENAPSWAPAAIPAAEPKPLAPQYDLLIIAPSIFNSTLATLASHKDGRGIRTILVNLEDIPDYTEGRDLQEDIKLFIKHAREDMNIKYVILGGDADLIPPRYCYLPEVWSYLYPDENNYTPSDLYYADLYAQNGSFCSWDANGNNVFGEFNNSASWTQFWSKSDQIDGVPDVGIGRLPAGNVTEMSAIVNKIVNYESGDHALEPWFNNVTLVGGDTFTGNGYEGEEHCEYIYNSFMASYRKITVYEGVEHTTNHTYYPNPENVTRALSNGSKFAVFACHGNYDSLGIHESGVVTLYHSRDIANLTNTDKLPVITFFSCHSCGFDCGVNYSGEDCIAEKFLFEENGGAIATIGSTRLTWALPDANLVDSYFYEQCANETGLLGDCFREAIANVSDLFYYRNFPPDEAKYFPPESCMYAVLVEHVLLGDPTLNIGSNPKIPEVKIVSPADERINGNTTYRVVWETKNDTPNATAITLTVVIDGLPYTLFQDLPPTAEYYWTTPFLQNHTAYFNASIRNLLTDKITYYQSPAFIIDSLHPEVLCVSPVDSEAGVSLMPDINVSFSEAMNLSSVVEAFSLTCGGMRVPCSLVNSSTTSSFTFRPDAPLQEDSWYYVNISTVAADSSSPGLHLQVNYTWKFRTRANTVNPVYVVSFRPSVQNVPINSNITVCFSEPINASSVPGGIDITPSVPYRIIWNETATALTLGILVNFAPLTNYTVRIKAWSLKSQAGNYLVSDFSWNFTTSSSADITPPTIRHIPVTSGKAGEPINITARITDENDIQTVKLFYKSSGEVNWKEIPMALNSDGNYYAVIPGNAITEKGLMYYIEATDAISNVARAPSQAPAVSCNVSVHGATDDNQFNLVVFRGILFYSLLFLVVSVAFSVLILGFAYRRARSRKRSDSGGDKKGKEVALKTEENCEPDRKEQMLDKSEIELEKKEMENSEKAPGEEK